MTNFKIKNLLLTTMMLSLSFSAFAKTKIERISFNSKFKTEGKISIVVKGDKEVIPELTVKGRVIQVVIPDAFVWPKIEKRVTVSKSLDTTIMAYQYNKETVRVRAILPYSLKGKENLVSVILKDGEIELSFPLLKGRAMPMRKRLSDNPLINAKSFRAASKKTASVDKYDESYLEKLLKDKDKSSAKKAMAVSQNSGNSKKVTDKVKMALSSTSKSSKEGASRFSISSYIGKFVAFLGIVLLFFFGVIQLMRKGVMRKGKLGFLNSTKMVEVLSTTYVGPKKNLIMVKAHNQVFLIGSSEKGIHMLSEIKDVTGLIKDGEQAVAGNNFDSDLLSASRNEKEFRLKEPMEGVPKVESTDSLLDMVEKENIQEKVKFSDQIKNKVKGLKSLQ